VITNHEKIFLQCVIKAEFDHRNKSKNIYQIWSVTGNSGIL